MNAETRLLIFPEAASINDELDSVVTKKDQASETNIEIKRLAKLSRIEYERERKAAAERLGITRITELDKEVDAARSDKSDRRGQGRPLEILEIEPWPDLVNGAELLDQIINCLSKYLVLPNGSAETVALWVVHTYAFQCFEHTPRLAVTSPEKQCGKTVTLDVIGELVARPISTSNITAPTVFRVVEKVAPTLLIDEADTFIDLREELRGILNDGHKRGGQTIRLVGDDHEPLIFDMVPRCHCNDWPSAGHAGGSVSWCQTAATKAHRDCTIIPQ